MSCAPIRTRRVVTACLLAAALALAGHGVRAESGSLFSAGAFGAAQGAGALVPASDAGGAAGGASLFAGRSGGSLFEPVSPRGIIDDGAVRASLRAALGPSGAEAAIAERLRHLIGRAEAGRHGYDAVQHGATRKPPKSPTALTIAEIYQWIAATPGQHHAIGRYQFIPATLWRLVNDLGIDEGTRFSPWVQDRLADRLLQEAGLAAYAAGRMERRTFMNNLARIWAGLPNSSGKSHYHGLAGNRATMTWAQFEAAMMDIFPG